MTCRMISGNRLMSGIVRLTYRMGITVSALLLMMIAVLLGGGDAVAASDEAGWKCSLLGGCGGVYFYAGKGTLSIEVEKVDLNDGPQKTYLRAILFGPDRRVLDEAWIDDDGLSSGSGPGKAGRVSLSTKVDNPGVYGMNITVTDDRYGEHMSWRFRTNCTHYLVETSRGHKDSRHEEPIVLRSPGREADVCFLPCAESFAIDVNGLTAVVKECGVYDASGSVLAVMPVTSDGTAHHEFPVDNGRGGEPWRLHLPDARAEIRIGGVTVWERSAAVENLSLWTPDISSWFNFHDNRWLLTPYSRTVYGEPASRGSVDFTLHNNSSRTRKIALSLEFESGGEFPAALSVSQLSLKSDDTCPVTVSYTVPDGGDPACCRIRATVDDGTRFSTWSSLSIHAGRAPAENPLEIPLVFKPYSHENTQLGYLPDYPLDNQVYFDLDNSPFIAAQDGIYTQRDGVWLKTDSAVHGVSGDRVAILPVLTKVAFDSDNDVYCISRDNGGVLLYHSRDHGASFTAWPVPGSGSFDLENFSGHNLSDGPPPFARFRETEKDPNLIWRRINDFDLFLPVKNTDGSIEIGTPVRISDKCIGISLHSGIPSCIVSRGNRVHVTWGEATEPDDNAPGVPTFVATYDRTAGRLSEPVLVGYGPPANDIHNTPCITMDSRGYLHVLVGTHGRTFKYVHSLASDRADGGWSEAVDVGDGLRQTYVGMVCGRDDTLHLVFRLWRNDPEYFPAGYFANLAYMSKSPGKPWSDARPLVIAPFSEYSIFYHRLTIDRTGRLFLSYDYWSTFWFYRTDHRGTRRSLMLSPDGGATWRLAGSDDLVQ